MPDIISLRVNANQRHHLTPLKWLLWKRQSQVLVRTWSNQNPRSLLVGVWHGAATLENNFTFFLQNAKHRVILLASIPCLGTYPREMKHIQGLVGERSQRHDSQQPTQLPTRWWMGKQTGVCAYSRTWLTNYKARTHVTTGMCVKNIMLNERSQMQKTSHCEIPLIWNAQKRQIYGDRRHFCRCLIGLGMGAGINCKRAQGNFLVWGDGKAWNVKIKLWWQLHNAWKLLKITELSQQVDCLVPKWTSIWINYVRNKSSL